MTVIELQSRSSEVALIEKLAGRINDTSKEIVSYVEAEVEPDKMDDLKTYIFRSVYDCVHKVVEDIKLHRRADLENVA